MLQHQAVTAVFLFCIYDIRQDKTKEWDVLFQKCIKCCFNHLLVQKTNDS